MKKILTSTENAIERAMEAAFGKAGDLDEAFGNFSETYPYLSSLLLCLAFFAFLAMMVVLGPRQ